MSQAKLLSSRDDLRNRATKRIARRNPVGQFQESGQPLLIGDAPNLDVFPGVRIAHHGQHGNEDGADCPASRSSLTRRYSANATSLSVPKKNILPL